jgi:hypothetical protein
LAKKSSRGTCSAIEEHRQRVELRDLAQNSLGRLLAHSGHQEGDGRPNGASKGPHGNVLRAGPAIRGDMDRPSGVGIGMTRADPGVLARQAEDTHACRVFGLMDVLAPARIPQRNHGLGIGDAGSIIDKGQARSVLIRAAGDIDPGSARAATVLEELAQNIADGAVEEARDFGDRLRADAGSDDCRVHGKGSFIALVRPSPPPSLQIGGLMPGRSRAAFGLLFSPLASVAGPRASG